MRRPVAFVAVLFLVFLATALAPGCGNAKSAATQRSDTKAAREYVRDCYSNPRVALQITQVEGPEYAAIGKIPRDHIARGYPDRSADCGVRVRFDWHNGNTTTHDDWVVWVGSDHKAVGFSGNAGGDKWRQFVQSAAKQ